MRLGTGSEPWSLYSEHYPPDITGLQTFPFLYLVMQLTGGQLFMPKAWWFSLLESTNEMSDRAHTARCFLQTDTRRQFHSVCSGKRNQQADYTWPRAGVDKSKRTIPSTKTLFSQSLVSNIKGRTNTNFWNTHKRYAVKLPLTPLQH